MAKGLALALPWQLTVRAQLGSEVLLRLTADCTQFLEMGPEKSAR